MNPDICIREMTMDDYDDAMALWQGVEGMGLGPSDSRENIARYLARNPGMSFVARDGREPIGAVLCGTDGRRGYLSHLAVRPSHRKGGVGRSLVGRCLAALKAVGIPRCNLFVFADNAAAIAFWRKMGWQFWEEREIRSMSIEVA
jgi:ribosomal protein S18 acetylase RimI-like enzyme